MFDVALSTKESRISSRPADWAEKIGGEQGNKHD